MTSSGILFYRLGGWPDRFRAYDLEIDRVKVGQLKAKSEATFQVSEGTHRVRVRVGGSQSDEIDVSVAADAVVRIKVAPSPEMAVIKMFSDQPWILIAQDPPDERSSVNGAQ